MSLYGNQDRLTLTGTVTTASNTADAWEYQSESGYIRNNNSNLDTDSRYCQLTANSQAPTYICRGITYCAPDETAIAIQALAQNTAVYDKCMMSKGYVPQ